jgi:hypothetical protein
MPSLEHNGFVELFREDPSLAPRFLATLFHLTVPPHTSVNVVEADLGQLSPVEFRADLVLELRDAERKTVLAIILEVQREKDANKKFSWVAYVGAARARKRCPTLLLVVATDTDVAAWAMEPIDIGLGRGSLSPLVLGPTTVPAVTDVAIAVQEPALAVLSAVAHGNGPHGVDVVRALLLALDRLDDEHGMVYFQIVFDALRVPMKQAMEAMYMERQASGNANLPPFIQKMIDSGEIKGEIKGKLEGKRDALVRLVKKAGITLSDDDRSRVDACTDLATLDRWFDNAVGAKAAADVFA